MRFLRDNSLSVFFGVLTLVTLLGQSIAGYHEYNEQALQHASDTISWARYLVSSQFGAAVVENWQSEFLQFTFFIVATIWLVQRGSNESKPLEDAGIESHERQRMLGYARRDSPLWARVGGWRTAVYQNSLVLAMTAIFFATWATQSVTGWTEYNDEQREHDSPTVSWLGYLGRASFWERTFQNWQSEFLAVGTMAIFTVYLRQRGSPESKPVGAPHDETGSSG